MSSSSTDDPSDSLNLASGDTCPTPERLDAFWEGRLDIAVLNSMSSHIEDCDSCVKYLANREMQLIEPDEDGKRRDSRFSSRTSGLKSEVSSGATIFNSTLANEFHTIFSNAAGSDHLGELGPYRICALLGIGGMGAVFRAEDTTLRRDVAIKIMRPHIAATPGARERFLREARAAASIKHEGVVCIHQIGEQAGVPYIAMELLDGETLSALLQRRSRLDTGESLYLTGQVLRALAAAHSMGIVHRDIKPSNIFLVRTEITEGEKTSEIRHLGPATAKVKIVDFGLARVIDVGDDTALTCSGLTVGTPQYMSPEQVEGRPVDARSDLFNVGCVLYRLIAGELPFHGDNQLALMRAILEHPHPSLLTLAPSIPAPVCDLVDQLLAKKPEDRFSSANEALRAIELATRDDVSSGEDAQLNGAELARHPSRSGHESKRWQSQTFAFAVIPGVVVAAGAIWWATGKLGRSTVNGLDAQPQPSEAHERQLVAPLVDHATTGELPSEPTTADVDRGASKWILRIGGKIQISLANGAKRSISSESELPNDPFTVTSINASQNPRFDGEGAREYLSGLNHLNSLVAYDSAIDDVGLESLCQHPSLQVLNLTETAITDAGIKGLKILPRLYELQVARTGVTESSLPQILAQPELRRLSFHSIQASDFAMRELFSKKDWHYLALDESWISSAGVMHLASLPNLDSLSVYGTLPISRFRLLSALPQLKSLGIVECDIWTFEHSTSLSRLSALESLWLGDVRIHEGWEELATSRPWSSIKLADTFVPGSFFDALSGSQSLALLGLYRTTQPLDYLQQFRDQNPNVDVIGDNLQTLDRQIAERLLRLGGTLYVNFWDRSGSGVASRLDQLPNTNYRIAGLYIDDCEQFNDRLLLSVTGLDDLAILGLRGSGVTPEGLVRALDELPLLTRLDLAAELFTPTTVQAMARHQNLESIWVETCEPEVLERLGPRPRLRDFFIDTIAEGQNEATMSLVVKQFPQLKAFGLGQPQLSPEHTKMLLALPVLQVLTMQRRLISAESVAVIARHPMLKTVNLYGNSAELPDLSPLLGIEEVRLGAGKISSDDVHHLAELPQLHTLTFDRIEFVDDATGALNHLSHVREINFRGCEIDDTRWTQIVETLPSTRLLWNGKNRPPVTVSQPKQ